MLSDIDTRARARQMEKVRREIQKEEELARELEEDRRNRILRERTYNAQQKLAEEMARKKRQEIVESAEHERLRREEFEIRDLENKLQAAYMNKEREHQVKEHAQIEKQKIVDNLEAERKAFEWQEVLKSRQPDPNVIAAKKLEEERKAIAQAKHEREVAQQIAFETFLREKKAV
ncbi:MAG: hypothetical protein EZS28_029478, partial [Streblomastix strix]